MTPHAVIRSPAPATPARRVAGLRGLVLAGSLLLLCGGCRDAPSDPLSGLVAPETDAAALALGLPLPRPDEMGVSDDAAALEETLEAWRISWEVGGLAGRDAREPLYAPLAEALGGDAGEVDEALVRLGLGVRRARGLDTDALPAAVRGGIDRAALAHARATRALGEGRVVGALEWVLRGSDALREVGPEAVARTVVREVEDAHGRIEPDAPYSEKDRERLLRLVRGGRQALDDGDWGLAIRRAFYARGLMEGNR